MLRNYFKALFKLTKYTHAKQLILYALFLFFFSIQTFSQGSGADGALSTTTVSPTTINSTKSDLTATAASGQKVVKVTSAAGFAATNLVFIIQMLGTNAGVWEVATISSISTNTITMTANLANTYTKSGSTSLAQVIKIPQYTNVTVVSGSTLTASAWDGTTGGVLVFYSNGTLTINGTIDMNGKAYRGGAGGVGVYGPNPGGAGGTGGTASCNNGNDGVTVAGTGPAGSASCGTTCTGIKRGGEGGLKAVQTGASGSAGEGPAGGAGGGATGAVGGDNFTSCWTGSCSLIQMGSGGGGGKAGDVSVSGGGGGGGAGNSTAGSDGSPGGQSDIAGDGGAGGVGGGIIWINANAVAGSGTGIIRVNGANGSNGTNGGNGGPAGNGGNGGNGTSSNYGGAGGGGQGADGSAGGGAGGFGAGGTIYLAKISSTYSGTQTFAHGNHGSVGTGGIGGPGGTGGTSQCGGGTIATNGTSGSGGANGASGVNPSGGGSGSNTLPIELLSFNAARNGESVSLSWATASETNNNYFTIEKSKDTREWLKVMDMKGAENSSTKKYYSSVDPEPYKGISYYRLKQTDYNGAFAFSNIVQMNFNISDEVDFTVNPTLSSGAIDVSFTGKKDKQVFIVVRNIFGKEYYSKGFILDNDVFVQSINLSGILVPGVYMVIASSNDHIYSKKILIK